MYTLLVTLHVLCAVFLVGPFVLAAFVASHAIRTRDARDTRRAAAWLMLFSLGTLLAALLGVGTLALSHRYSFGSPWAIISMTLYVIALGIATGFTLPATRKAARLIERGPPEPTTPAVKAGEAETSVTTTSTELATKQRLDTIAGQVAGSGTLIFIMFVVITIFMVIRPFGA